MTYITSCIRSFVIIALCSNSVMMFATERSFDPYSSTPKSRSLGLYNALFRMKNIAPAFLAFLDRSSVKMHDGYDRASKIVADNPKEVSAVAATALVVGLLWYKSEAIKAYFKSEQMKQYKQNIAGLRDSAVATVDNKIAKIPVPFNMVPLGIRHLIAFVFNRLVAMDSEYVALAVIAPMLGYANSFTPFAMFGGINMGYFVSVASLVRGWMGIDAARVIEKVDDVDKRVVKLQESVNSGHLQATENHNEVLGKIHKLKDRLGKLSEEMKKEIETSSGTLGEKIDASVVEAEKLHEVLSKSIVDLKLELMTVVEKTCESSNVTHKKQLDEALAETVNSFKECLACSIEMLDKKIEKKSESIENSVREGLEKIDFKQDAQAEKIEDLTSKVDIIIQERQKHIKDLTQLVESTKSSNSSLLQKVDSTYIAVQEALKNSDEKYNQLLGQKIIDGKRLEEIIIDQISGLQKIEGRLSVMENNLSAMDQKIEIERATRDTQCGVLAQENKETHALLQQMISRLSSIEDAQKKEREEREKLHVTLMQQQEKQNSNFTQLTQNMEKTAEGINSKLDQVVNFAQQASSNNMIMQGQNDENLTLRRQEIKPSQRKSNFPRTSSERKEQLLLELSNHS